ncbi:MAG: PIN domain-containing protein [Nanoarchaeota archaeon]|nr:PIN domain-containing protein [Nanoarchaeota archaeon]
MAQKSFYLDSCIWLNLFKKEGDPRKGTPYWKIAKDFIENVMFSENKEILYSGFILRELQFRLKNDKVYKEKRTFLREEPKFKFIKVIQEDKVLARKLESESCFEISFYDCLHMAICERTNSVLVTRDYDLIEFAKDYIKVQKPENLLL